jgi:hypothetical protein
MDHQQRGLTAKPAESPALPCRRHSGLLLPSKAGLIFESASAWHDASEMTGRAGYLHAKLVYFDMNGRSDLLCIGSANPSAPAWGVGGSDRNEELVIAWSGSAASEFARELGLHDVGDLAKISAKTLKEIDAASSARTDETKTNSRICGLALISEDGVEIPADTFPPNAKCLDLFDDQDHVLCAEIKYSSDSKTVRASLPGDVADRARIVRITTTRGPPQLLLCHHTERRTAAARTADKRRSATRFRVSRVTPRAWQT